MRRQINNNNNDDNDDAELLYRAFPGSKLAQSALHLPLAIGLFIQGPSQLPGEHTAELKIRGQHYRLHNHKCHHY
jgi:hypothetical protein